MTVVIVGAGGAAATAVTRSLRVAGGIRVVGVESDPYAVPLSTADETYLLPAVGDPGYRDALDRLIDQVGADVVHAQPEAAVRDLAERRMSVPGGWMVPTLEVVDVTQDKFASAQAFLAAGVPHPRTFLVRDRETLGCALDRLRGRIWLRRRHGAGGAGAIIATDFRDAAAWVDRHDGWGGFTAATVAEGRSFAFQSLWVDGRLVAGQSKVRLRWANSRNTPSGVGGSAGVSETVSNPELVDVACRAVRAVDGNPHGLFGVDMVWDGVGDPLVTEVNAGRFHTTVDMLTAAGLNLPAMFIDLAAARVMTPPPVVVNPVEDGVVWIRGMDREPVLTHRTAITTPGEVVAA